MCRLSDDLICLGSRLGDSLLIRFTKKQIDTSKVSENDDKMEIAEPQEKKMKISNNDSLFEKSEEKDTEMDFLEEGECILYHFGIFFSITHIRHRRTNNGCSRTTVRFFSFREYIQHWPYWRFHSGRITRSCEYFARYPLFQHNFFLLPLKVY